MVRYADEFWKILADFPKVNAVVFGHVHQTSEQKHQNVTCYSPPSTCIQFKRHQVDFALDEQNPGYRWLSLFEDGNIETGVKRIDKYIGKFETDSKGY
jgi:Icc protein